MKKGTIIVVGVFVTLLVAVLATREDEVSVGVRKFQPLGIQQPQVTALEVSGARTARVEKDGTAWRVLDPARPEQKYVADAAQVTHALTALSELRAPDFVTDRAEAHADHALDAAQGLTLKVTRVEGPPIELVLGKRSKSGGFYVRQAGANEVFAASGDLDAAVRKDVKAWRQHAILSLKPEEVTQLTLRSRDGAVVTFEAGASAGEWLMVEARPVPPVFRFDPALVEQVARRLASLRAQDFLEGDAAADAATGLGGAHDTVEATLKGGKAVVVHLAPAGGEGQGVAARVEGDPQVYLLAPSSADALRKRATDLRDLHLFRIVPAQVTRLTLRAGPAPVQVVREGGQWKLREPKTPPAGFTFDPAQVEALLGWLGSLRASRLLDGMPTDAQMGVSTPGVLVELSIVGAPAQRLRLGRDAPPSGAGVKEVQARGSLDALAYAVPEDVKTRLAQGLQLFKTPEAPPGLRQLQGLEQLPPELREQIEAQLRARQGQQGP